MNGLDVKTFHFHLYLQHCQGRFLTLSKMGWGSQIAKIMQHFSWTALIHLVLGINLKLLETNEADSSFEKYVHIY